LYVRDLANYITLLVEKKESEKGIYNISGDQLYELKKILVGITRILKSPTSVLKFDSFPMRENQSLLIKGSMRKFHSKIGKIKKTSFRKGLLETVNFYKSKQNGN
jgi:nucleoside-diphosphate-sugar epimerase